jgi:hypothetical protein
MPFYHGGHMEDNKDKGFTVKDKRTFTKDGEVKETADDAKDTTSVKNDTGKSEEKETKKTPPPLPEISFSSFILSLSSSALFHFGEIPDPVTNKKQRNLSMAKQTIDILGILKEKTVGNLKKEEESLLDNLLYDLRIRYIDEIKKEKS